MILYYIRQLKKKMFEREQIKKKQQNLLGFNKHVNKMLNRNHYR